MEGSTIRSPKILGVHPLCRLPEKKIKHVNRPIFADEFDLFCSDCLRYTPYNDIRLNKNSYLLSTANLYYFGFRNLTNLWSSLDLKLTIQFGCG
jgi:hypothetical protein